MSDTPKLLTALSCQLSSLLKGEEKEGEIEGEKTGKIEEESYPYKIINALSNQLSSLLKGEDKEEEPCPYKIKSTKNRNTILVNCRECEGASSLNYEPCRKKLFSILLKEGRADSLVLSRLYEREYEGKALALLYALAEFRDCTAAYGNLGTFFDSCPASEDQECAPERKAFFDSVLEYSESSPLLAFEELTGPEAERLLQKAVAGLLPTSNPECRACSEAFYTFLSEMREKASGFGRGQESSLLSFSGTGRRLSVDDYEARAKPYVRPPFSTSRIYTEAPDNTEFLECYDISRGDERVLELSLYRFTDRPEKLYLIRPPEYNLRPDALKLLERARKKMILHRPEDLSFADPAGARRYFRRMARDFLLEAREEEREEKRDEKRKRERKREKEEKRKAWGKEWEKNEKRKESLTPTLLENYSDLLARYTNGLGILEDLLSDERITDVYINAPADKNPVHVVLDGEECVSNVFFSQDDLDSLVSRFRTISGRPFGEAIPVLELNLEDFGVRVSVIGDPLSANGLAYAFRKHALTPWTLPRLINTGSISAFAAGFLSFLMDGQASVLLAGEVGAGKTSLLSAMLLEIPQKYRILTIEDTLELPVGDLQALGWKVQGMSSRSSILKSGAEFSPDTALRAALRLGSSALVLGEVRGPEVKVLYEAMQVGKAGNSVIGTIHGSSVKNVYERIVHTLGVPATSFKATDAVVVCSNIRPGGSMRRIKRVSQIAEVRNGETENPGADDVFTSILEYDAAEDLLLPSEVLEQGQSELVEKIARKWGISVDLALQNIDMRTRMKEKIADAGRSRPGLLEAGAVARSNNMFWLLMDSLENEQEGPDFDALYTCWERWFEAFSHTFPENRDLSGPKNRVSEELPDRISEELSDSFPETFSDTVQGR